MARYARSRLLQTIPLLLILSIVTFGLLTAAPGDPAQALLQASSGGRPPRPEDVVQVRHNLGLDEPLPARYAVWLVATLHGDFGVSYLKGRPVAELLGNVIPPTLALMGASLILLVVCSLGLGVVAGLRPGSLAARAIGVLNLGLYSVPTFLIALGGVLLFSVQWHLFPSSGMTRAGAPIGPGEVLSHLVLPTLALAFGHHLAAAARLVEAAVAQTRTADYLLNARARGLPERVVLVNHVVRTSLGPFLAQIGTSTGGLLGGAYAVEAIFSWPGMGRTGLQAATGHDYPVLMAIVLLTGVAVVLGNLVADLAVAWLDPRVRLGGVLPRSLAPDRELAAGEAVLAS